MDAVGKALKAVAEQACLPVEVLINCAGTSVPGTFDGLDPAAFEKMMRVNYFGSVRLNSNPTRDHRTLTSNGSGFH